MSGAAAAAGTGSAGTGAGATGGAASAGAGAQGAAGAQTAAPGAGASGAVSNTGAPNTAAGAAPGADYTAGLPEDLKGYAQNKGWKNVGEIIESGRNLEKLVGVREQLVTLPKTSEDTAGWDSVYDRLGRPKNPDGYGFQVPKGQDPGFITWAAGEFHKLGLTETQGKKLMESFSANSAAAKKQSQDAQSAKAVQDIASLKQEWGAAYDQEVASAKRAGAEFGVDAPKIEAIEKVLGTADTIKFFNAIGKKIGDPKFITGNPSSGGDGPMTPAQAQEQIKVLRGDPGFVKKYTERDTDAMQRMERLHKYAHPETA